MGMKDLFLNEKKIMVVILMNTAIIFLMYFPQFHHNYWLELIDQVFIAFFVVEAIVKLNEYKPKAYFANRWNVFDFIIVVCSLPALLVHFVEVPDTSLLILLRLFRLIRLIRFLRFIPNVTQIVRGLGRALQASVFVLISLIVLNFLLAIFTCHFYGEIAPEFFGNPLIASYSIFQMFTVEGWNEIPTIIASRMENTWIIGITRFYFVLVVLVGGIFGMSLANAVFVDEMTIDNNRELEIKIDSLREELLELKEMLKKQP